MTPSHAVLFVCYANVCRSPLAAGLFGELAHRAGVGLRIRSNSAGTHALHGMPPHPLSRAVAEAHGFSLTSTARPLEPGDLRQHDLICAMDERTLADLERLRELTGWAPDDPGMATCRLLRSFVGPSSAYPHYPNVPDPIGQDRDAYERTYEILDEACRALLRHLLPDSPVAHEGDAPSGRL